MNLFVITMGAVERGKYNYVPNENNGTSYFPLHNRLKNVNFNMGKMGKLFL